MSEQQQDTAQAESTANSTRLAIIALMVEAVVVFWHGWGKEMTQPATPQTSPPPAAAARAAQPAIPAGPRPTVGAPPARPGALKFAVNDKCFFDFGRVFFLVIHYNQGWTGVDQQTRFTPDVGFPKTTGGTWEYNGTWSPAGVPFTWRQTIKQLEGNAASFEVSLMSEQPVTTNALALGVSMPAELYSGQTIIIDGEPLKLKEQAATAATAALFPAKLVNRLEIATPAGNLAIEGPVIVFVQDNRAYGENVYYIRLGFTPDQGMISEASLKLTFREIR